MKFAIQINANPTASNSPYAAYRFIDALLKQGHSVVRVFFYQEGVYQAFKYAAPPDDEFNFPKLWSELARRYAIDLVVCISAAQRRGLLHADEAQRVGKLDEDLAPGFRISGLGQWVEAALQADRCLVFG
ncbi:MAG: sulfurtransferase complex subunit TusD [Methylomicrobium sp.]